MSCRSQRTRSLFAPALVLLALLAASCSGSDVVSDNIVPIDAPAPGVIYVSTSDGDLQVVTVANSDSEVLMSGSTDGASKVVDLAPSNDGVHVLLQDPAQAFEIGVGDLTSSGLQAIDSAAQTLACIDPHADASVSVAHEVNGGTASGTEFVAVAFAGGNVDDTGLDLVSVACPRWTADRSMVATATPLKANDASSIITVVQTTSGERHEIGFTGCGTTPTSFSPNDEYLTVAIVCYSALWENSGLYLVPVSDLDEVSAIDALTKLGSGLYGRTSWHPDGEWVAAIHADAIERQNIAQDLGVQPLGLQAIEVDTLQIVDLSLAGDAAPFSLTWLDDKF